MKTMNKKNKGFTLIEVLIAMVVISFSLLGYASLQSKSIQNNNRSYYRSQAVQLSMNIIDSMRANMEGVKNNKYIDFINSGASNNNCFTNTGCSNEEMVKGDIFKWKSDLGKYLPLGSGDISKAGDVYTIFITWDKNGDGFIDNTDMSISTDVRF